MSIRWKNMISFPVHDAVCIPLFCIFRRLFENDSLCFIAEANVTLASLLREVARQLRDGRSSFFKHADAER